MQQEKEDVLALTKTGVDINTIVCKTGGGGVMVMLPSYWRWLIIKNLMSRECWITSNIPIILMIIK